MARFGTPSTISLPDAIFRRLDQIGTDTRLARLEARLQAAEARIAKLTVDANGAVTGAQPFGAG